MSLLLGKAEDIIPNLNTQFDFVFIDAGKIDYINYLKLLETKLNDRAIIIADNVISHATTVKKYLDYTNSNSSYASTIIDIDSGLEISIFSQRR